MTLVDTDTVMVAVDVPVVGVTLSQLPPEAVVAATVKPSAAVPEVFEIETVCDPGAGPDAVVTNTSELGVAPNAAVTAGPTVSVTGMVSVEFGVLEVVPVAVTTIDPV